MGFIYALFGLFTAVIGHHMHQSIFFTIMDFLFPIIVWAKWIICQEVTLSIIKSAFSWFLA